MFKLIFAANNVSVIYIFFSWWVLLFTGSATPLFSWHWQLFKNNTDKYSLHTNTHSHLIIYMKTYIWKLDFLKGIDTSVQTKCFDLNWTIKWLQALIRLLWNHYPFNYSMLQKSEISLKLIFYWLCPIKQYLEYLVHLQKSQEKFISYINDVLKLLHL